MHQHSSYSEAYEINERIETQRIYGLEPGHSNINAVATLEEDLGLIRAALFG